jgi:hypothetical protein
MLAHKLLVLLTVVIIGVGAAYTVWSIAAWRQYQTQYTTTLVDFRASVDAILKLPQKTEEEKNKKTTSLYEIVKNQTNLDCRVGGLFDWQRVFGEAQRRVDECVYLDERLVVFHSALEKVATFLQDEQKVAAIMTGDTPEKANEENFEAQATNWQKVQSELTSLGTSEAFKPVQAKAKNAAKVIQEAWQRLSDANKAQDQSAYEDARAKVSASYDSLATIAPVATTQLAELLNELTTSYKTIFNE